MRHEEHQGRADVKAPPWQISFVRWRWFWLINESG
jgi:hypothetical protein